MWDEYYSMTDELCYKEQLLVFDKQSDGSWKCDYYQSVPRMSFVMPFPLNNQSH